MPLNTWKWLNKCVALVVTMIDAEKIKKALMIDEAQLQEIIFAKPVKIPQSDKLTQFCDIVARDIDKFGTQQLIVALLRLTPAKTKPQLMAILEEIGKVYGNWFKGGNFNNRLLKAGVVKVAGEDENSEQVYSLTRKGEITADELLSKIFEEGV